MVLIAQYGIEFSETSWQTATADKLQSIDLFARDSMRARPSSALWSLDWVPPEEAPKAKLSHIDRAWPL